MPWKPSTWTIYFPRFKCPHCKRVIRATYAGGRFKFGARKGKADRKYVREADAALEQTAESSST